MRHLPSMQTLRALDAAARHQSYSRAAEELGLTHGAISHRIRELELRFGERLFERHGPLMIPTDEAKRLLARVRHALEILETTFDRSAAPLPLRLTTLASLAVLWLVPRLGAFRAANPDIGIEIETSDAIAPLSGDFDVALRYGAGPWPGLACEKLSDETLFPVCAPALIEGIGIEAPSDLTRCPLLRHSWQSWAPWLRAAGLDVQEPTSGALYGDSLLLLEAAASGEGVALGRGRLVEKLIAEGRLCRLFEAEVRDVYSYYFVQPIRQNSAAAERFGAWLRAEMARMPDSGT